MRDQEIYSLRGRDGRARVAGDNAPVNVSTSSQVANYNLRILRSCRSCMHARHKRLKEAAEYSALLSRTLPAVIRSEAENERYVATLERVDPGYACSDDQGVDVVGAFVGFYGF